MISKHGWLLAGLMLAAVPGVVCAADLPDCQLSSSNPQGHTITVLARENNGYTVELDFAFTPDQISWTGADAPAAQPGENRLSMVGHWSEGDTKVTWESALIHLVTASSYTLANADGDNAYVVTKGGFTGKASWEVNNDYLPGDNGDKAETFTVGNDVKGIDNLDALNKLLDLGAFGDAMNTADPFVMAPKDASHKPYVTIKGQLPPRDAMLGVAVKEAQAAREQAAAGSCKLGAALSLF